MQTTSRMMVSLVLFMAPVLTIANNLRDTFVVPELPAQVQEDCNCGEEGMAVQQAQLGGSDWFQQLICRFFPQWCNPQPPPPPPPDPDPPTDPDPDPPPPPPDPDPTPSNAYFTDGFNRTINAGGTHGWTSALSLHTPHRMSPSQFLNEINQVENPDRFFFATDYVYSGSASFGVRVTGSDHWQGQSNVRNEIERRYINTREGHVGDESWYRFKFLIPAAYPNNLPSNSSIIFTQFLKENNDQSPYPYPTFDAQIAPSGNQHRLRLVWHRTLTSRNDRWRTDHQILQEERWYDICFHIKWETNNTGFARFYVDQQLVRGNYENRPTLPPRGDFNWTFHKIGGYGWNTEGTREFRYDDYQVGKGTPPFLQQTAMSTLRDAAEDAVTAPVEVIKEGLN